MIRSAKLNHFIIKPKGLKEHATSLGLFTERKKTPGLGRWETYEKHAFLRGLMTFGKGKWKAIGRMIPTRTTIQVKTHAQMVIKRIEAGEDVFAELSRANKSPSVLKPLDVNVLWSRKRANKLIKTNKLETRPKENSLSPILEAESPDCHDTTMIETRDIDAAFILTSFRNNSITSL